RAMDRHSSGCLPAEKSPTFASDRQGRGPITLLGFHPSFHLTRPRDVFPEESPAYVDGSALASLLGSPVIIVQVRSHSSVCGSFHPPQSPAKVNGRPSFVGSANGSFGLTVLRHS